MQGSVLWLRAIPKEGHSCKPSAAGLWALEDSRIGSEEGTGVRATVSITVHPLSGPAPLTSYSKFVLSGDSSSRILVSLISWELLREELVG